MSDELVVFKQHSEEIVSTTLNRPEKRNALNIELMQQLCVHGERIERNENIRIWILRAEGPAFCAGLDVKEVQDPELGIETARMVKQSLSTVYRASAMTIAMIRGAARGGGAGLVAACDFAVADPLATIGFPEVRRGLVAAQVLSVLVRKLRGADVRDLLLRGEGINAERALHMGLFHRVGDVEKEARALISQLLKSAPGALAKTKQLIDRYYGRTFQDDIEIGMLQLIQSREGEEGQEGMRAFLEKRKPAWEKEGNPSV